jgi:tRNA 2-selenouridine synthase
MPQQLDIDNFLSMSAGKTVLDVRTPKEFEQGHIPGAINLPIFTNEERAVVGTIYKQQGREAAILKGLELVGPKLASFMISVKECVSDKAVFVHCWRGGMRSGSMAWLLELYGYKVFILKGGYKKFRQYVLSHFEVHAPVKILSGKTGSGKTYILQELQKLGAQIVDLEKLASHKGSAFGSLGEKEQPTQEQFENELALAIHHIKPNEILWLEDESRMIGKKVIPEALWNKMRHTEVILVDVPFELRVKHLMGEYGKYSVQELEESVNKITRRLGPQQTQITIKALHEHNLRLVCEMCLQYYDKSYSHGLTKRENPVIKNAVFNHMDFKAIAEILMNDYGRN